MCNGRCVSVECIHACGVKAGLQVVDVSSTIVCVPSFPSVNLIRQWHIPWHLLQEVSYAPVNAHVGSKRATCSPRAVQMGFPFRCRLWPDSCQLFRHSCNSCTPKKAISHGGNVLQSWIPRLPKVSTSPPAKQI